MNKTLASLLFAVMTTGLVLTGCQEAAEMPVNPEDDTTITDIIIDDTPVTPSITEEQNITTSVDTPSSDEIIVIGTPMDLEVSINEGV